MTLRQDKIARSALAEYVLRGHSKERRPFHLRRAETYSEVISGLDSSIMDRSSEVTLSKQDAPADHSWAFKSSTGHTVRIEIDPRDVGIDDPDVLISCSCPFWQYSGPEYHAQKNNYLNGDARGTADSPDQRDPERDNYLCKHAYAALTEIFN